MCDEAAKVAKEARHFRPMPMDIGEVSAMAPISDDELFTYHSPSWEQQKQYEAIRAAAKYFVSVLRANAPYSADLTASIRKVREAVMTANAAIALHGRS